MAKRVALFLPSLVGGGAERSAMFVGEALERAGYAVDLVVAQRSGVLLDHPFAQAHMVPLGTLPPLLALPAYLGYLRRRRPDLVISFVHSANLLSGLAALVDDTPFVVSVRSTLRKRRRDQWWVRRLFGFGLERRLYRRARFVQTVSRDLAAECGALFGVPEARSWLTYSTVADTATAQPRTGQVPVLPAAPFLLSIGRLVPIKGFATLIRAFAAADLPREMRLVILGEGPQRDELAALAASLGVADRVDLAGWHPAIGPWLAAARGFVFASRGEGLARAVLEAVSARLPVAAARSVGVTEGIDDGRLGRLIDPDDVAGFARAMEDIASRRLAAPDPQATAGHLARFTPEAVGASYVAMVEACIGRPSCVAD
jgi:glycosyltransferase involved in cell wall biosynthesis